jgi:hypothetical protein
MNPELDPPADPDEPAEAWRDIVKESRILSREVHSGCEVPSGCGGVVMRFVKPARSLTARLQWYGPGDARLIVNGQDHESCLVELEPGRHVIAFELSDFQRGPWAFSLKTLIGALRNPQKLILASASDRWRWSSEPPADDWLEADFDDSAWHRFQELTEAPDPNDWTLRYLLEEGDVQRLHTETAHDTIWTRAVIELKPEDL